MFSFGSAWHRPEKDKTKNMFTVTFSKKKKKKKKKWAARLGFSFFLREILNNSMLKIQYKHESLIFFCSKKKQDHTVFSNIMQCSWTRCLSIWSTFWIIQPFPICRVYICANFPNSEGSCPIPKTLLWNASVRFCLFCALCWNYCLKKTKQKKQKTKKKKTVGGTRNDPFSYSNTSNMFCLISKYLLLASQTNINIILQDFLYSFGWRRHWSQWKGVIFKIKSYYFSKKYNLSKLVGKSCSSFICSLKTSISFPIHSIFINVCCGSSLLRIADSNLMWEIWI